MIDLDRQHRDSTIIAQLHEIGAVPDGTPCEHCAMRADVERRSWGMPPDLGAATQDELDVLCQRVPCETPWVPRAPTTEGVRLHSSRTAYWWDGQGEDPNRPVALCPECAAEHHEYWDERWDDYRSSCGV